MIDEYDMNRPSQVTGFIFIKRAFMVGNGYYDFMACLGANWEKSVLATHGFLSQPDFIAIKEIVQTIDFNLLEVYCLLENRKVIGFVGVAEATPC